MKDQKQLWDNLAKENSRYYIDASKGRRISEDEFTQDGWKDYQEHILNDGILNGWFTNTKKISILDLGSGTGRLTEYMTDDFHTVYAVDISQEMIRQGKERLPDKPIVWMESDGVRTDLQDESIDFVFSFLVFQHMKTNEMVVDNFREIHRILKSSGLFKVLLKTKPTDDPNDRWWSGVAYSEDEIEEICKKTGFWIVGTRRNNKTGWYWLSKT